MAIYKYIRRNTHLILEKDLSLGKSHSSAHNWKTYKHREGCLSNTATSYSWSWTMRQMILAPINEIFSVCLECALCSWIIGSGSGSTASCPLILVLVGESSSSSLHVKLSLWVCVLWIRGAASWAGICKNIMICPWYLIVSVSSLWFLSLGLLFSAACFFLLCLDYLTFLDIMCIYLFTLNFPVHFSKKLVWFAHFKDPVFTLAVFPQNQTLIVAVAIQLGGP